MFDEVKRAKVILDGSRLNHNSGKFNFHYMTEQECLDAFEDEISVILPKQELIHFHTIREII